MIRSPTHSIFLTANLILEVNISARLVIKYK